MSNKERKALRIRLLQLGGAISACWDKSTVGAFDQERAERAVDETTDAILAAGYRKPRTITTAEELDALNLPAIIDSPNGGPAKVEHYAGPGRQKYVEPLFGDDDGDDECYSLTFFASFGLPATVLHEATK